MSNSFRSPLCQAQMKDDSQCRFTPLKYPLSFFGNWHFLGWISFQFPEMKIENRIKKSFQPKDLGIELFTLMISLAVTNHCSHQNLFCDYTLSLDFSDTRGIEKTYSKCLFNVENVLSYIDCMLLMTNYIVLSFCHIAAIDFKGWNKVHYL